MYLKHTFQIDKMFDKKIIRKEFDIVISGHFRTLGMFILKNYRCWVLLCFVKQDTGGKYKKQIFLGIAFDFYFQGCTPLGLLHSAKLPNMVALKSLFVNQFTVPFSLKRLSELLCQDLEQVRN